MPFGHATVTRWFRRLFLAVLVVAVIPVSGPAAALGSSSQPIFGAGKAWMARYDGPGHGDDRATDVGVSPDGATVFVTGRTLRQGPGDDYGTIAYDAASGAERWVATYNGPGNGDDVATALGVSPDGATVFVTGIASSVQGSDYGTIAYDASTGAQRWVALDGGGNDRFAYALAVSPDGATVFVAGESSTGGTIAYDAATGSQRWAANFSGVGLAVAVARDGASVFVTGFILSDYLTVGYDAATGARRWMATYDGTGHSSDQALGLGVSPDGIAVFVTGQSWGVGTDTDYATVSYDAATGAERWVARYDGPATSYDFAYDLGVSPDGSLVFVTGYSLGVNTSYDYATLAYEAATGTQRWVARYDDVRHGLDQAGSLRVSPDGASVFVTGESTGSSRLTDYATVTYDAATGARVGVTTTGPGIPAAIAVSPDGSRLFVTGDAGIYGVTATDFGTVAYDLAAPG